MALRNTAQGRAPARAASSASLRDRGASIGLCRSPMLRWHELQQGMQAPVDETLSPGQVVNRHSAALTHVHALPHGDGSPTSARQPGSDTQLWTPHTCMLRRCKVPGKHSSPGSCVVCLARNSRQGHGEVRPNTLNLMATCRTHARLETALSVSACTRQGSSSTLPTQVRLRTQGSSIRTSPQGPPAAAPLGCGARRSPLRAAARPPDAPGRPRFVRLSP